MIELKDFAENLSQLSSNNDDAKYGSITAYNGHVQIELDQYLANTAPNVVANIESLFEEANKAIGVMSSLYTLVEKTETLCEFLFSEMKKSYDNCIEKTNTEVMNTAIDLIGSVVSFHWEHIAKGLFVTCSSGIAIKNENEATERWLARALYGAKLAKRTGGNQVTHAPLEVAQNEVWDLYGMGSDSEFKLKKIDKASVQSSQNTTRARRYR